MSGKSVPRQGGSRQAIAAGVAAAALSLTGTPVVKTAARLVDAGIPAALTTPLLHAAPVLATIGAVLLMQLLGRTMARWARLTLYAAVGGAIGILTGVCLDLFSGFGPALERLVGPMRAADSVELAAWGITALSAFMAGWMALLATFGTPAMRAMSEECADPESMEVRGPDRVTYTLSAVGMAGQALFVGALAVTNLLEAGSLQTRAGVTLAVVLGAGLFAWSSWRLWRLFDEMLRKVVVEAYAWTGLLAFIGCLAWAVMESLKLAPPMSAYAAIVILVILQTFVTLLVSSTAMAPHAPAKGRPA